MPADFRLPRMAACPTPDRGDPADPATMALLAEVRQRFLPNTVLALKKPGEESMLPLLEGRTLLDGKAAAYVCENYACKLPVTNAQELGKLLDRGSQNAK